MFHSNFDVAIPEIYATIIKHAIVPAARWQLAYLFYEHWSSHRF
jgi:hypothetical protein